jgi:GntR family transcriptional regulator
MDARAPAMDMPPRAGEAQGSGGVSLYARVASALRARIAQGEWLPGDQIATIDALAAEYGVATITVRLAIKLLVDEGTLRSSRGRGTHVLRSPSVPLASAGLRAAINDPRVLGPDHAIRILARREVARLPGDLDHAHGRAARYQHVHKLHEYRGTAFALMDIYVEASVYARFPPGADERHKLSLLLRDHSGVRISESREEMTIIGANRGTAELLRCPIAAPLVRVRRWRTDKAGVVIYACVVLYRGDLFVWEHVETTPDADHFGHHIVPTPQLPLSEGS